MRSPSTEAGKVMLDEFEGATFVHEHILAIEKEAHAQLDVTALTNAIHWSGMMLVDSVTGRPVDDAEQTVARYYIDALNASESPLPPCPICGKPDLFIGTDGRPGCPHCEVAVRLGDASDE